MKGYSGYVNLPANPAEGRKFDVHTYFWFFQARQNPANAPLSIWLQGGPGVPSITAALGENGPCSVLEDSKSTALNPWSWNDKVNMLYIDQPVTTGFSYVSLVNGVMDLLSPAHDLVSVEDPGQFVQTNVTTVGATVSVPDPALTVNTTAQAARTMWHFAQVWFQE